MFFSHIIASLSEMEKELISERTKAGLVSRKEVGKLYPNCVFNQTDFR